MKVTTIAVIPSKPDTLPPKDGTWVSAQLWSQARPIALQFDPKLNRWFNGKGHAVAEKAILSWESPVP